MAAAIASPAAANGRFPRAQRLIEAVDAPNTLALYGTYGLMVSRNGGTSWRHVCEAATGAYTGEDPLLEFLPDRRLLARTETALVTSQNGWCSWQSVLNKNDESIQDITRDPTSATTILALIGTYDATNGFSSYLVETSDEGATWSEPNRLPPEIARGLSLDVAPSSSFRVVVTGLDSNGQAHVLVSDDRGESWLSHLIADAGAGSSPYLAAIARTNPDRFFVRTDTYRDIDGIDTANDALLLSVDRGMTFVPIFERKAKLLGFALSPDEKTILLGYGDPVVSATYVDPADVGIFKATLADVLAEPTQAATKFEKIYDASVTCLRWTSNHLYACTSQSEKGFEVGRAPNADFTLATESPFEPLLRLPEVVPLACATGTQGRACYDDPTTGFPAVCVQFQASCDAGAVPFDAAPEPGNAGAPNSSGTGGTAMAAGGNTSASGGGVGRGGFAGSPTSDSPSDDSSSCACRHAAPHPTSNWKWLVVPATFFHSRRRRRIAGSRT